MADTDQVLNLAAIIRKVDGNHSKGAAALAESILDHPGFRAVLARWGNPAPQLPTDGEVAEVMGLFRHWAEAYPDSVTVDPYWLTRAADLLQRLNPPQPVPVSERLPGPKDCDAEGRCWFGTPGCDVWGASWVLRKRSHQRNGITSWLPAHSLPLPEVGE